MAVSLLFVYNAQSGIFNSLEDYLHKIIKPATYQCKLCGLTYGNLGMKTDWKLFLDKLEIPVEFLHKDEFEERFPDFDAHFPSAFLNLDSTLHPFISKDEMNSLKTLDELIYLVMNRIRNMHQILKHSGHG